MIYAKLGGILAAVIAVFTLGYHVGGLAPKARYEALVAEEWQAKAKGEEAAKTVIAGQLVDLQRQNKVNSDARDTLAKENDAIVADHGITLDRVRRLEQLLVLASSRRAAASSSVPQNDGGSAIADASGTGGITEIEQLLIDAKEEAERNANRLDSLIAEVKPQVQP